MSACRRSVACDLSGVRKLEAGPRGSKFVELEPGARNAALFPPSYGAMVRVPGADPGMPRGRRFYGPLDVPPSTTRELLMKRGDRESRAPPGVTPTVFGTVAGAVGWERRIRTPTDRSRAGH